MKTAVEAPSSCEQKKNLASHTAEVGGADPVRGSLEESESGGSVLSNSLKRRGIQTRSNEASRQRDNHLVFLQELAVFGVSQD